MREAEDLSANGDSESIGSTQARVVEVVVSVDLHLVMIFSIQRRASFFVCLFENPCFRSKSMR